MCGVKQAFPHDAQLGVIGAEGNDLVDLQVTARVPAMPRRIVGSHDG